MGVPSQPPATAGRRIALLCLALAVAFLFYPALLGEGLFYFRDVSLNHYPTRIYASAEMRSGHFPFWNPYLSGGIPLAANPNNLILHPITLLFLAVPVGTAFTLSIVLQFLLAAWSTYRLAEEEGMRREAALAAALVYGLSGPLVSCGSLLNLLSSWAWVPVALLALARHRRTGSRVTLVGFSAALAVQLLAGDLVGAGTTILIGAILALTSGREGASGLRRLAPVGGGALLACGLSLVVLLPAREMISVSSRAHGIPYADALVWSVPPVRLLELLVPALYGDPTALKPSSYWGGMVFQKGYPFLLSLYLGVVPCILGLAASVRRPALREAALGAFALLMLLVSLGSAGGIYPVLYRVVPLFSALRYPSRFVLCASIALALLSGLGLDRLRESLEHREKRDPWTTSVMGLSLLAGTCALGMAFLPGILPRFVVQGLGIPENLPAGTLSGIVSALRGSFVRCGLLALGFCAVVAAARRGRLRPSWAIAVILLAVGADLLTAGFRLNPVVPDTFYQAHPPAGDLVDRQRLAQRVYPEGRPPGFAVMAGSDSAWWGYYWDEVSCRVSTCLPWRIPMAYDRSTDLLSIGKLDELSGELPRLGAAQLRRLCDLASVGLVLAYRDLEDPSLTAEGRLGRQTNIPFRMYRNHTALPRAYFVSRAIPQGSRALESLTREDWDPHASVLLEGIVAEKGAPGGEGQVEWVADRGEVLELRVETSGPGWVVLTDNHYPGWTAELDGRHVPILRANFLFRAVEVAAGLHRLTFRYSPRSWWIGGAGTIASLALAGVWMLRGPRRTEL